MAKKKWYGNVINRIEEGHNYTNREIKVDDDITMYHWSDRSCFYVTRVIDQKHIFVRRYYVSADHSKEGGMGHQDWLYFKTSMEDALYWNECIDKGLINYPGVEKEDLSTVTENPEEEWVYRYNGWWEVSRYDYRGNKYTKPQYHKLEPISFGVRDDKSG